MTEKNEIINDVIDPLEKLVNLDFDDKINIDEYSEIINLLEKENANLKSNEAEEIISTLGKEYLSEDFINNAKKTYKNINNFYKQYDPNSDEIKNMSEIEKTNVYSIANFLNKNYSNIIDNMLFTVKLTKKEYIFLSTALERKLTYDGNEVFNIIDLNEKYLKKWKEDYKKLSKDDNEFSVEIDIKNIVMLYHFLQKHTVKGMSAEFYIFATLLQKIGDTNKLYNAFNINKERLKTNFLNWTTALETKLDDEKSNDENNN